jgi:hypothetical protein
MGREPTLDELKASRAAYSAVSHPRWSLDDYNAHLEAAVLAWVRDRLASAEVREAVAEALSCGVHGEMTAYSETAHPDHNRWSWRGDGHGEAIRQQYWDDADEALAAVREALTGHETRVGADLTACEHDWVPVGRAMLEARQAVMCRKCKDHRDDERLSGPGIGEL